MRPKASLFFLLAPILPALISCGPAQETPSGSSPRLSTQAELGRRLFHDPNLSEPRGTSCASCHNPALGFSGTHGSSIGAPLGSRISSQGYRNTPSAAYQGFSEPFGFKRVYGEMLASGGHFWDGRADNLEDQVSGPFFNPIEMNNKSKEQLSAKVAASDYSGGFRALHGGRVFENPDVAFSKISSALAAFEREALSPFSSKYDGFIAGKEKLSAAETRGMALFMDEKRANCAHCHTMNPQSSDPRNSLFTNHHFYALGFPRNHLIPANQDPSFHDLGLCGPEREKLILSKRAAEEGLRPELYCGQFKTPSLRNSAQRPFLMHNGLFRSLPEAIGFYSTRARGQASESDLPERFHGNVERNIPPFNRPAGSGPLFTPDEINDLSAFLQTLSDRPGR